MAKCKALLTPQRGFDSCPGYQIMITPNQYNYMKKKRFLQKGQKVKLITPHHGESKNNPIWGGSYGFISGTVLRLKNTGLPVQVIWDNGSHNAYSERDLEVVKEKHLPDDLFEI